WYWLQLGQVSETTSPTAGLCDASATGAGGITSSRKAGSRNCGLPAIGTRIERRVRGDAGTTNVTSCGGMITFASSGSGHDGSPFQPTTEIAAGISTGEAWWLAGNTSSSTVRSTIAPSAARQKPQVAGSNH